MAGRGRAEAEPPTGRAEASRPETQQRGTGWAKAAGEAEAGQSITHADRTLHGPRQAAQGAENPPIAHHDHRGRAERGAGQGAQLPTHRAKRATAAQDDQQRVRGIPI